MTRTLNLFKSILMLVLFPLLLVATFWITLVAIGYLAAGLALLLDTTFVIPLPITSADIAPHWLWDMFGIQPYPYVRPTLLLPAPTLHLWQQFVPLANSATQAALPYLLGFAVIWLAFGFRYQARVIEMLTDARGIAYSECPPLYDALEAVCQRAGVPMPRLYLVRSLPANAFATGLGPATYSITVTAGLLAMLDREEVEAVLAHELTHIRNHDVRQFVIAAVMVGMFSWLASVLWTTTVHTIMGYRSRYSVHVLLLPLVAVVALPVIIGAFLSAFIKVALMREREIEADAGGAALTSSSAMASALRAIASSKGTIIMPRGLRDMVIYNPDDQKHGFIRRLWRRLFSTHPTFDQRLRALAKLGATPRTRGPGLIRLNIENPAR